MSLLFALLFIYTLLFRFRHSLNLIANLNISNRNENGAFITPSTADGVYDNYGSFWSLFAEDDMNQGFHLELTLNSSWQFHSIFESTLSLEVTINDNKFPNAQWKDYNGSYGKALIVVFDQPSASKSFVTRIDTDHYQITPQPGTYPYVASYNSDDPMVEVNTVETSVTSRFVKLMEDMSAAVYQTPTIESTLRFTLHNVPLSRLSYTVTIPHNDYPTFSHAFYPMDPESEMKVYFAMDSFQDHDALNIESISIELTHDEPTVYPSIKPTLYPSSNPTSKLSTNHEVSSAYNDTMAIISAHPRVNTLYNPSNDASVFMLYWGSGFAGICLCCVCVPLIYKCCKHKRWKTKANNSKHIVVRRKKNDLNSVEQIHLEPIKSISNVNSAYDPILSQVMIGSPQAAANVTVDDDDDTDDNFHSNMHIDDKAAIRLWLQHVVRLPKYYDVFIENGYESIEFVKDIQSKQQLNDIGITALGHQTRIFSKIKALQQKEKENEDSREDDIGGTVTHT